ncbi:hypothetical protein [Leptospira vanthielii]|uniref:Uncharacterized protein n=1 Tax=Leptospira vanthielii serovar Holland str. Waz Holland = ATCC 700522 TaxID=1218591 RepID=N1WBN3_9LEPT|nr:hypothetical protein [Leptospira vanthielii]EMY70835.1 hypothetical protein LEP1GSC199_1056 [Leptospira vanthielii serovar Holland str. Waz Holland = ATCC 700522]
MNQINYDEFKKLDQINTKLRPKSETIYEELTDFTKRYRNLNTQNKEFFRTSIPQNLKRKFLAFSGFLAEYAIYKKDDKYISAALLFHSMEDFSSDYRENIRFLILINHSSNILGQDLEKYITNEIDNYSPRAKRYFEQFLEREKSLNSIEKFDIQLKEIENFPIYTKL